MHCIKVLHDSEMCASLRVSMLKVNHITRDVQRDVHCIACAVVGQIV